VRNVFDKLGIFTIDRIDVVLRKNEKGESYKRFFVHIKDWAHTDDAQKAKERLIAGKELKIVYDDPWFWKVGLNTWAPKQQQPLLNDRKPRIRLEFEEEEADKNIKAANTLLTNVSLQQSLEERDRRPYSQRRLDPVYCEQDIKQGFRDRRKPLKKEEKSVEVLKPIITQPKPQKKIEEVKKQVSVMNPEIRLMVATYHGIGRDEVTEELYKNTSQFVRDLRQDDMDRQKDEDAKLGIKPLNYSAAPAIPPQRNRGKIVE
jgi:hypothetical protein